MSDFERALAYLAGLEGIESDHPADRGGHTLYGISYRYARSKGYRGRMEDLPHELAVAWYREDFWDVNRLSTVCALHEGLAFELFEAGVLSGPGLAGRWAQTALNVFNRSERDWDDLTVDGRIGPLTLDALRRLQARRGDRGLRVLQAAVNAQQGAFLIDLAERDETQEAFAYGWINKRVAPVPE